MRVNLPSKLGALRSVTAAQLKAMYDAIVTVLNGHLDGGNFAPSTSLPNARKLASKAWLTLAAQLYRPIVGDGGWGLTGANTAGPSRMRWKIPTAAPTNRKGTLSVAYWSWQHGAGGGGAPGVAITAGTVDLLHTPAGGVEAVKASFNLAGKLDVDFAAGAIAAFDVNPGDILEVKLSGLVMAGVWTLVAAGAAVWLKTVHVP